MLLLPLRRTLILGVPLGVLVGGYWTDPAGSVLLDTVITDVENNCNPHPRILETLPNFFAYCWLFVFASELISSTLLLMVSKCWCGNCRENCKQNESRLIRASYWVGSILKSKCECVIPGGPSFIIYDESFNTFPEALINDEAERLYTPKVTSR